MQTLAAYDFWCYILITWHPESGLQFYGNSNLKASLLKSQANSAPVPVYSGKPNFAVGRGLNQDSNQMCGLVYMSSIAVFKQYLTQEWVNKVFGFFWKNSKWIFFSYQVWLVSVLVDVFFFFGKINFTWARAKKSSDELVYRAFAHCDRIRIRSVVLERENWRT